MEWTYHHDPEGGFYDLPQHRDIPIVYYWTREDGVRIGLAGRGKSQTFLTYRDGDINFRLTTNRVFEDNRYEPERDYEGPYCNLYIDGDLAPQIDLNYLEKMLDTIRSFLLIYRCPQYPDEPLIEHIVVPLYHRYLAKLGG
jgi:hypothetical protein